MELKSEKKKDAVLICAILLYEVFFYRCIYKLGLHSIDDWEAAKANSQGWNEAFSGIINSITKPHRHLFADTITRLLNYLQIGWQNIIVYRLFTFIGVLVSVFFLYVFLKRLLNYRFAASTVLIFIFGTQIFDLNYNGFISFSWVYQLQISLAFATLIFHIKYYDNHNKFFLICESLLYFATCCFYESFIVICVPILAISIAKLHGSKQLSLRNLFSDLWIPLLGAVLFISVYSFFYFRESSFSYAGTQVGAGIKLTEVLYTLSNLTFSNLPGYLVFVDDARALKYIIGHFHALPLFYLIVLIIALFGGVAFISLNNHKDSPQIKRLLSLSVVSLITAFLIATPLALTTHYIGGVCSGMLVNYGVSYYCWFCLAIMICALLQILLQLGRGPLLRIVIVVVFAFSSFWAMASNDYYQQSRNEKFYSAETVAQSGLFFSDTETTDLCVIGFEPIFGSPEKIVSRINAVSERYFSAYSATGPYYEECRPNSAFIRRFTGASHGEIVAAFLDEDYQTNSVTVFIPIYNGTQQLKIEYGPEFSLSTIFPLDGSLGPHVIRSEIVDTAFGGRIIRLTTDIKYDFRYALAFASVQR